MEDLPDGYLGQQLTKMEAWKYSDADCILFWDSDVIASEPIDIQTEYFQDGKPILYKTRYSSIESPWKAITEKAVGFGVEWEYMRRMPLVYRTVDLQAAYFYMVRIHKIPLRKYIEGQPFRQFSEFNVIGACVEGMHEEYHIVDTESINMPPNKVQQHWSWGGITNEVQQSINKALQ